MHKLFRIFTVVLFVLLFLGISSIAEEITLTTYYPAPYGAYEELEVSRSDADTSLSVVNTGSSTAPRYPGLSVRNYLGTAGGHPYVAQSNYGGTKDTPLATPSGTLLGTLIYSGYNGTADVQVARIGVRTTANFSAVSSPVDYPADMYFAVGTNGTCCGNTRMTIKGDTGNVGIGTTAPGAKLEVYEDGAYKPRLYLTGNPATSNAGAGVEFRYDVTGTRRSAIIGLPTGTLGSDIEFWTKPDSGASITQRMTIDSAGNVGIGTTGPGRKLDVAGNVKLGSGVSTSGDLVTITGATYNQVNITYASNAGWGLLLGHGDGTITGNYHGLNHAAVINVKNAPLHLGTNNTSRVTIDASGDVGIGCDPSEGPPAKLKVNGKIRASDTTGADKGIFALDLGEDILAKGCEAGDVVVIDPDNSVQVIKSTQPFDKTVAGIISESPIFHIGDEDEEGYLPLALAGRVRCKVSVENGPIERGDLLTTSSTPGNAMKATDRERSFGAILGKALEPFSGGPEGEKTGKIVVLVTLQ